LSRCPDTRDNDTVRGVILAAIVVACSAPMRAGPPAPRVSPHDAGPDDRGAIAGHLVERSTHAELPGVTLVAQRDGAPSETEITDEHGAYRLRLVAGTYHMTLYYLDATIERDAVAVAARETTQVDATFDSSAARPEATGPVCPDTGSDAPAFAEDVDALVHAALARFSADPEAMPDWRLFQRHEAIWVFDHVAVDGQPQPLHAAAFASLPRVFVAKTRPQIQVEADRRRDGATYLEIESVDLDRACATIEIAVRIALPTNRSGDLLLCCCFVRDLYMKHGTTWTFVGRALAGCA
jgi:hypothetical protein